MWHEPLLATGSRCLQSSFELTNNTTDVLIFNFNNLNWIDISSEEDQKTINHRKYCHNKDQIETTAVWSQVSLIIVLDVQHNETTVEDLSPCESQNPENSRKIQCGAKVMKYSDQSKCEEREKMVCYLEKWFKSLTQISWEILDASNAKYLVAKIVYTVIVRVPNIDRDTSYWRHVFVNVSEITGSNPYELEKHKTL